MGDKFRSLDHPQAIFTRTFKNWLHVVHIKFNVMWDPILFEQNFNTGVSFMGSHMTLNLICTACNRFLKVLLKMA